jgi:hypothetical protein
MFRMSSEFEVEPESGADSSFVSLELEGLDPAKSGTSCKAETTCPL